MPDHLHHDDTILGNTLTNAFGGSLTGLAILTLIILMVWYLRKKEVLNKLKEKRRGKVDLLSNVVNNFQKPKVDDAEAGVLQPPS